MGALSDDRGLNSIDKTFLICSILFQEKASPCSRLSCLHVEPGLFPTRIMLITPCKQADFVGGLPGFR